MIIRVLRATANLLYSFCPCMYIVCMPSLLDFLLTVNKIPYIQSVTNKDRQIVRLTD